MGHAAPSGRITALVRRAGSEDAVAIASLLGVLGYPCTPEEAAVRADDLFDDDNQTLLLAEHSGEVVGLVCCDLSYYLPLGALTCRITALAVDAPAQRQGVGRLLLREAEAFARAAGAVRIELTSAGQRLEAHEFYRACGYDDGALRFVKRLRDA